MVITSKHVIALVGSVVLCLALSTTGCMSVPHSDTSTGSVPNTSQKVETMKEVPIDTSDKISERDIRTATRMGAPLEVIDFLKSGQWYSTRTKSNIRFAEAVEDHLAQRYGVTFEAQHLYYQTGFMKDPEEVVLKVVDGPYQGETVTCTYWPYGARDGSGVHWADNYLYYLLHEQYEEKVSKVVEEVMGDLPHGSWVCKVGMANQPYEESQFNLRAADGEIILSPNMTLEELGPYIDGYAWVYFSPDCGLSESQFKSRSQAFEAKLKKLGLQISWSNLLIPDVPQGQTFTKEWASQAALDDNYSWRNAGVVSGVD